MAGYDRHSRGRGGSGAPSSSTSVKVEGLAELDRALEGLSKAVGRGVLRRALMKAGQPIAARAKALAPKRSGKLAASIVVSTKAKTAGGAAYAETLQAGGSRQDARIALRAANRSEKLSKSSMEVYIGPAGIRYAALVEFGTRHSPAFPYLRPAWAEGRDRALSDIQIFLGYEIEKAHRRAEARARRAAGG